MEAYGVDGGSPCASRRPGRSILNVPVVRFRVDPRRCFTLVFESGASFTVFDGDADHESFRIHVDEQPEVIVWHRVTRSRGSSLVASALERLPFSPLHPPF